MFTVNNNDTRTMSLTWYQKHILSELDLIFYFSFAFAKNPVAIRLTENRTIMGGIKFQLSHSKYLY